MKAAKSFGLALGSGGARGLAHIAVIEALDDIGAKPVAIAGSSIGALITRNSRSTACADGSNLPGGFRRST